MNILGISAYYHDSAACLVRDGEIVAAAQEERFTRRKHDHGFPQNAVDFCLDYGGLSPENLDLVAFYDKPLLKFDRLLETWIGYAPRGFKLFLMGMPLWLKQKLHTPRELDRGLRRAYEGRYLFPSHHESHAASAFYPSPFQEAAVVTLDGVGEWATGTIGAGRDNEIEMLREMRFPHSLGLLYSAFTYFTGFRVNSGEYKLMGLAPYGEPVYRDLIVEEMLDIKEDGSFRMDMSYFGFCHTEVMTSPRMEKLFGGPPRRPESEITRRGDGPGRVDPGGDRGDRASDRPPRPRADGRPPPGHGRRRGPQLRRQRAPAARGPLRGPLGPAGRRRRGRRPRGGPVHLASAAGPSPAAGSPGQPGRIAPRPPLRRRRGPPGPGRGRGGLPALRRRGAADRPDRRSRGAGEGGGALRRKGRVRSPGPRQPLHPRRRPARPRCSR